MLRAFHKKQRCFQRHMSNSELFEGDKRWRESTSGFLVQVYIWPYRSFGLFHTLEVYVDCHPEDNQHQKSVFAAEYIAVTRHNLTKAFMSWLTKISQPGTYSCYKRLTFKSGLEWQMSYAPLFHSELLHIYSSWFLFMTQVGGNLSTQQL